MDATEARLGKRHAAALNRWVELDAQYKAALPPVFMAGQPSTPFPMTLDYHMQIEELENEVNSAWVAEREAAAAYGAYVSTRQRSR